MRKSVKPLKNTVLNGVAGSRSREGNRPDSDVPCHSALIPGQLLSLPGYHLHVTLRIGGSMLPIRGSKVGWWSWTDVAAICRLKEMDPTHLEPNALENEGSWFGQMVSPTECELMWARFAA